MPLKNVKTALKNLDIRCKRWKNAQKSRISNKNFYSPQTHYNFPFSKKDDYSTRPKVFFAKKFFSQIKESAGFFSCPICYLQNKRENLTDD